jgi:protein ImuB
MHPRAYRLVFPDPGPKETPSVLRVRPASPPPRGPEGEQATLALDSRELWIAAHVPQLSIAALRSSAPDKPLVVIDPDDHNRRIVDADSAAQAAGVRPGMTLGAALAAAPHIDARPRDGLREQELMQRLAGVAAQFTPLVSIEAPDGLLLEVKPSIRLFGGLRELCRRLRDACLAHPALAQARVQPCFTLAPTALAALAAARAGARCFITDPRQLPARLKPLPVQVLRWPEEENARLAAMGVRTLGELMRLPRAGFARRFGATQLADLDRLLGRRADPRRRITRRERYRGVLDLDHEIEDQERILQSLAPLLAELEEFLRARQRGITALQCRFHHYRAAPTMCTLRLAAAEGNAGRIGSLLRERLATLALPEPVRRCELRSGALSARVDASRSLWSPGERGHASAGEMPALVEHLRARLGMEAVYGLRHVSEHRPENAWQKRGTDSFIDDLFIKGRMSSKNESVPVMTPFRRPLWLLQTPQPLDARRGRPLHRGALELEAGPERIESGWWDGADVRRDYFVARDERGARLWVYREIHGECRNGGAWFLHGIFG